MRWIQFSVCVLCGLHAGCGSPSPAATQSPEPAPTIATAFDPATCGRIAGRVTWNGAIPETPPFHYSVSIGEGHFEMRHIANPNRPLVDPQSKGVEGAVVFLSGIDSAKAKPWDLPPVRVELRDLQILVKQGSDQPKRAGFVRRGQAVEMASAESVFHVLRGRGAAYFSFAFPEPNQPLSRTFDQPGIVELSSGAGYFWARSYLFVDDAPYFALTDREGRFAFEQVPAGPVKVNVWHPHWQAAKQERDPETGLVTRQTYLPSLEVMQPAQVEPGKSAAVEVRVP